jgi:hypothetical protein
LFAAGWEAIWLRTLANSPPSRGTDLFLIPQTARYVAPAHCFFGRGRELKEEKENGPRRELGRVLEDRRLYRGDLMRAREGCQILLASIDKVPLSVDEMAVAFENSGRSIDLFPVTLYHARRKRLVRQDAAGLLTLTVRGRQALTRFRS